MFSELLQGIARGLDSAGIPYMLRRPGIDVAAIRGLLAEFEEALERPLLAPFDGLVPEPPR